MLPLLTDEHVSPRVAKALQAASPSIDAFCMRDWQQGQLLSATDEVVLREADHQRLTLVTYDLRTIPPLLRNWAEQGLTHSGVILIDEQTIQQSAVRRLVRALRALWIAEHKEDWRNRVMFLRQAT